MGLRNRIAAALFDEELHPDHQVSATPDELERARSVADKRADAVVEMIEDEQKHARADALFWAARKLQDIPIECTALTGPYWHGQGWKDAADHLRDLAEWDPSDGEAERTWLSLRVQELEAENARLQEQAGHRRSIRAKAAEQGAASALIRHDQEHGHYDLGTARGPETAPDRTE